MPSLLPGYEYDIFISYRQNDNRSGWVRQFVEDLREELGATLKDPVNIYFDENPHDGLQDTHLVDESLKGKLKCLIFIPILSRTYCDPKSFAWNYEFLPFCRMAGLDSIGPVVRLENGNAASRVLPILIHDIDVNDKALFERESQTPLRAVEFVFRAPGVSRPLSASDSRHENQSKTIYRDQINKVANSLDGILKTLTGRNYSKEQPETPVVISVNKADGIRGFWHELGRRHVIRAAMTYLIIAMLAIQVGGLLTPLMKIEEDTLATLGKVLILGLPVSMVLAWFFEASPQGFIRTTSVDSISNPYPPHRKKPLTSMSMVIVLALALGLIGLYVNLILEGETHATYSNPATVAVLPFKNNSPDPNDQYLADAISDDLINRLSTLPQLRITNRRSTQEFRGELGGSYDLIARELKVNTLLTGSLQRVGNEIIVRAQLIDGKENRFIWGNTYRRTTRTFMTVQRDIVLAITRSLGIGLDDEAIIQLSRLWTSNDTAYFHYQRGRSLYYRYRKSANDSAVQEFKQAIQTDPTYALAWAGLGDAYSQIPTYGGPSSWQDSALLAGERAIALDSTLAEGYKAMANAYNYKKLYDKAFPLLKKAVALSPSNAQAVGNLGTAYFLRTELVEALELQKRSAGLTPKNWIPYQIMGWIYGLAEEREKAIEALQKSIELNPYHQTYELLGYNLVAVGRKDDALALIPSLLKLGPDDYKVLERAGLIAHFAGDEKAAMQYFKRSIENNENYASDVNISAPIGLGQLLLKSGRPVEADVLLTHALETYQNEVNRGSQDDEPPFRIAAIYAIRGDKVEMIKWLERATASKWIDYTQVLFGPWFAEFRNDPDLLKTLEPVKKRVQEMRKQIN